MNSRDQLVEPRFLQLEPDIARDGSAVIGCVPERPVPDLRLVIGSAAVIRSGSVLYAGSRIGARLNVGHNAIIREENVIGDDFSLWSNSTVDYGCVIGDRVKIHHNVYVAQFTVLEDDVFLAPGVMIANDPHPGCARSRECMRGPAIKRGAQIGVNATILPFVTIGERVLVGAGSVVTRDVPPGAVVVGNPARVTGRAADLACIVEPPLVDRPYPGPERSGRR